MEKQVNDTDPGDGLPKETPQVIEFKWNKDITGKRSCDTQHMLYLLQLALEKVHLRTIERNKYFNSIGRTDRYINQLDSPQFITNFLKWHNENEDKNSFDGNLLDSSEKLFMINGMIGKIDVIDANAKKKKPSDETNWECIPIYNKTDWKIRKTMDITIAEFKKRLNRSMNSNSSCNKKIPISDHSYIQIVSINDNVNIGILFRFDKPTSIHLDGQYLKRCHFISPETNAYHNLNMISSNITHLNIENDITGCDNTVLSDQDVIEYEVMCFVNEWNSNPTRPKYADLEKILQCFREYDVMNEYIRKERRKELMSILKREYEIPKAISSALWDFCTNK